MRIFGIMILLLLCYSCYEDKGNYEYKELNTIEIEKINLNKLYFVQGDTLLATPKLEFKLDSTDTSFEYEWQISGGRIVGRERDLEYVTDTSSASVITLSLKITDKFGVSYSHRQGVLIRPGYGAGWVILGEKEGTSRLSFLQEEEREENGEKIKYFKEFPDIFFEKNKIELGGQPLNIHEFFAGRSDASHLVVFQEGGLGAICMEGGTFKKTITVEEEFMTGKYPQGFFPSNGIFGNNIDMLVNDDGDLYIKKNENKDAYYTGRFLDYPVYFEKGLEVTHLIRMKFYDGGIHMIYDNKNKRFLVIEDEPYGTSGGRIIVPWHNKVEGFDYSVYAMGEGTEYVFCDCMTVGYDSYFFNLFKDNEKNKYYMQKFKLMYNWSTLGVDVTPLWQAEFPRPDLLNGENVFALARDSREYLFFSGGSNQECLYGYIFTGGKGAAVPLYDFEGERITALYVTDTGAQTIGVGLANGKFYLLDISVDSFKNGSKVILESKVDLGKIKAIHYKVNSRSSIY